MFDLYYCCSVSVFRFVRSRIIHHGSWLSGPLHACSLTTSSKLIIVSSRSIRIRIPTWLKAVHPHHPHAYQVTVVSLQVSRASSTYVFLHLECVLPCSLQLKTKYLQSTYLVLSNYCNGILFKCRLSVESEITVVCTGQKTQGYCSLLCALCLRKLAHASLSLSYRSVNVGVNSVSAIRLPLGPRSAAPRNAPERVKPLRTLA